MLSCVIWFVGNKFFFFFLKPACFCSRWSSWLYCRSISRSFSSLHLIKADRDFILAPSGRPGLFCRWCSSQAIKSIRAQWLFVLITAHFTSLLHNKSSSWKGLYQLAFHELISVLWVYYSTCVTRDSAYQQRWGFDCTAPFSKETAALTGFRRAPNGKHSRLGL